MKSLLYFIFSVLSILFIACSKDDKPENLKSSYLSDIDGDKMLKIINQYRAKGCKCGSDSLPPVNALKWNVLLEKAALRHSKDMNNNNLFNHTGSDSSKANERIKAEGYAYSYWAENILMGTNSLEVAMDAWMNSAGHCKNIMNKNIEEIGAAKVGTYWTQDFGSR
ncbi:MAG: CAP domain-containing protein [Chitinophagales bacterium]|nr:CAP domain-containing protein [Chitinophagales bacterium]